MHPENRDHTLGITMLQRFSTWTRGARVLKWVWGLAPWPLHCCALLAPRGDEQRNAYPWWFGGQLAGQLILQRAKRLLVPPSSCLNTDILWDLIDSRVNYAEPSGLMN